MNAHDELAQLLRPAGGGLYLVSTGKGEQQELTRRLYGVERDAAVRDRFVANLGKIADARAVIVGVPSDVGAGFVRGSNLGPQGLRTAILEAHPEWPGQASDLGIIDLGDVFVVPQLLHDDMLSPQQKVASARALYPTLDPEVAAALPVSPLSIAERVWDLVFAINPEVAPFVIGGDHSNAWPVVSALSRARKDRWSIVQPDAHTDLLSERLGVKYCFATWSYHANELLGRDGRMVQVGIRASGRDQQHWESTLGVRQFWARDCLARPVDAVIDDIIGHLRTVGAESVYFSNDIDGTDEKYGDATGTPEPEGLTPEFVSRLIERLGKEIGLLGGDIMEVAPPLGEHADSGLETCRLGARYLVETIAATLQVELQS